MMINKKQHQAGNNMDKRWYRRWAEVNYDKDSEFMRHDGQGKDTKSRNFIVDLLKEGDVNNIADVGCGPAIDLENMLWKNALTSRRIDETEKAIPYVGMDVTEGFFRRIMKLGAILEHPISFRPVVDPRRLPANDGEFDVVYSRHVLEHQPDHLNLLSEMLRIAKKKVVLVFFIPPFHWNPDEFGMGYHRVEIREDGFYYNTYSRSLLEHEILSIGGLIDRTEWIDDDGVINEAWVIRRGI